MKPPSNFGIQAETTGSPLKLDLVKYSTRQLTFLSPILLKCRRFAAMTWKVMAQHENTAVQERYEKHLASGESKA